MVIQDALKSWFLRNVIKPRTEEMDTPGFVVTRVGGKSIELREVFFPESLIIQIEDTLVDSQNNGAEKLYSIGKRFGWRYASIADFPQINSSKNQFKQFFDFFMKYIEIIYANKITYTVNPPSKDFEMMAENYSVCRKNGKGYLLTTGAISGVMAYLFEDKSVEAVQPHCQGQGGDNCKIRCGTSKNIESVFKMEKLPKEDLSSKHRSLNKIREVKHANNSLEDLMDKGFFDYKKGILSYNGERYVPSEVSLLYLLETMTQPIYENELFDTAFEVGQTLGQGKKLSFVSDYLPALGWGDVKPVNNGEKIYVYHYPWTQYAEETDFPIFRGLVSGIISGIKNEEIRYENYETKLSGNGFNLILTE